MNKLLIPHAKLFYFIAELYKNSIINEANKLSLKGWNLISHKFRVCNKWKPKNFWIFRKIWWRWKKTRISLAVYD